MPEGDRLAPFLHAVHRQLRGPYGRQPAPSPDGLRSLLAAGTAGAPPAELVDPRILSAFFSNLDLLPDPPRGLAAVALRMVTEASSRP